LGCAPLAGGLELGRAFAFLLATRKPA